MWSLLRRNSSFRYLFLALLVSYCGDWFATVAIIGKVHDLTDSSLAIALVWVAQSLPAFITSAYAGPVADRFDRRRVMIIVSSAQSVAALGFLAVGEGRVWMAFIAQGAITALSAFFGPASGAALPNIVDEADLRVAASALSATWGTMLAVGASLGAVFTVAFGRNAAFIADTVSFALAASLIAMIRRPTNAADAKPSTGRIRPIADTVEALRYARTRPALFALFWSKAGLGMSMGVVGLLAVFATDIFDGGDGATGFLLAARGIGAFAGPIIAGRVAKDTSATGLVRLCAVSGLIYGAGYFGVGVSPALGLAFVGVLVAHLGSGTQWTLSTYGLQVMTPDEFRGRVLSADFAVVTLTSSISFLLAGWAARHVDPRAVMIALAFVGFAWALLYTRVGRRLSKSGEDLIPSVSAG
ncbi:MAG: MFS transporter [Acidimicrobiia bacterium]